jgi:hypothetical protein
MPAKKTSERTPKKKQLTDLERREIEALKAKILQLEGGKLNRSQERDIAWHDRLISDTIVDDYTQAVPKGDYCAFAGRQHKQIDDAAKHYRLPIGGPSIDLHQAIRALHDLIAANASRLRGAAIEGDRDELEDEKLRQQIAKLQIENERLTIALEHDRGDAIPRAEIAQALNVMASTMREKGRALERISPEARNIYNEMLDSIADEIESGRLAF